MAKEKKRQWGTGRIVYEKRGLAIRWAEKFIGKDGRRRRKWKYEFLGPVTESKANKVLIQKIAAVQKRGVVQESQQIPNFKDHAERWKRDILPTYKYSVRVGHGSIIDKHLLDRFGTWLVSMISTADFQAFVTDLREQDYSPHSIHHYHEVFRAVMREAVSWYGLERNPAAGVRLPKLKAKREQWALTAEQCGRLLGSPKLTVKGRAMVALAIVAGVRRGELLGLKWSHVDEGKRELKIEQASYLGHVDTPKTEAGVRPIPLDPWVIALLNDWRRRSKRTKPNDFVFGTRTGKVENPNNILRRQIYPACDALKLARASWLTFRRTFSTLAHHNGVAPKVIAEVMGHADVDTQFLYIQSVDERKRAAAGKIAEELSRFCADDRQMGLPWVN